MSNSTASPITIDLHNEEFILTPLSYKAIGSVTLWLRSRFIRAARLSVEGDSNWRPTMTLAFELSKDIGWKDEASLNQLSSFLGKCRLLYESLKPCYPLITFDRCTNLLSLNGSPNDYKLTEFWDLFILINDIDLESVVQEEEEEDFEAIVDKTMEEVFEENCKRVLKYGIDPETLSNLTPTQVSSALSLPDILLFDSEEEMIECLSKT